MAGQTDFKHITVNPAEEEDVVIHAGAVEAPHVIDGPKPAEASVSEREQSRANPYDGYHPTTLEDIKSSRMPKTQVAVIVLAVAAIAAFVAWYVILS